MATGYTLFNKAKRNALEPLRFREDGTFRILHLTDIHKVHPDMDDDTDRSIPERKSKNTINTIEKVIEKTTPDLIVFGGDNIGGHWEEMTNEYALWCLNTIIGAVKKYNIPLAVVFGNHDAQNEGIAQLLSKEVQMSIYMQYGNFRGCSMRLRFTAVATVTCRFSHTTATMLCGMYGALIQTIIRVTPTTALSAMTLTQFTPTSWIGMSVPSTKKRSFLVKPFPQFSFSTSQ